VPSKDISVMIERSRHREESSDDAIQRWQSGLDCFVGLSPSSQ